MKANPKLWLPLVILLAGAAGVALLVATKPRVEAQAPISPAPLVRVATVAPEPVQFSIRAHGSVKPRTESELVPQVSGELVWVSPSMVSGGYFEQGELLVRIDRADYEADLESARAAVARAESEFARARKERARQRKLAGRSAASQAQIDDAENAYRVAEAASREATSRLDRAERDLSRTELRAPFEGRVREESVDVGQFVSRGTEIAMLYAIDSAEVRLPIPDRDLAYLDIPLSIGPVRRAEPDPDVGVPADAGSGPAESTGPQVWLRAEFAGVDLEWLGHIVRTEGEIDPQSRMVHLVARVDDPYGRHSELDGPPLAVGLFVEAEIAGRKLDSAVVLPRSAVRPREAAPGAARSEGHFALVVTDEGRLSFRDVEVIRLERERVVIGAGLEAGERVCISPLRAPVDGMAVRIADEPERVAGGAESRP